MICQIYSALTPQEALDLIDAGVDFIGIYPMDDPHYNGVYPGDSTVGSQVTFPVAKQIMEAVGDKAVKVILSLSDDREEILKTAEAFLPDYLHVSGPHFKADKSFREELRIRFPAVKLMHVISVGDASTMDAALRETERLQEIADCLILDTAQQKSIGASGKVHDWNISKKIVQMSKLPVILAGGLGPDNVLEAVKEVKPWGVDSFNKTNLILPDGSLKKDLSKVRDFCRNAKSAEENHEKL